MLEEPAADIEQLSLFLNLIKISAGKTKVGHLYTEGRVGLSSQAFNLSFTASYTLIWT